MANRALWSLRCSGRSCPSIMIVSARLFSPCSRGRVSIPRAAAPRPPLPSIGGAIFQTSGATTRTPGIARKVFAMSAGRSLKTGLGEFSRRTIRPCILPRVLPIRSRMPCEMLNRPRNARTGIVRPIAARAVREGA